MTWGPVYQQVAGFVLKQAKVRMTTAIEKMLVRFSFGLCAIATFTVPMQNGRNSG